MIKLEADIALNVIFVFIIYFDLWIRIILIDRLINLHLCVFRLLFHLLSFVRFQRCLLPLFTNLIRHYLALIVRLDLRRLRYPFALSWPLDNQTLWRHLFLLNLGCARYSTRLLLSRSWWSCGYGWLFIGCSHVCVLPGTQEAKVWVAAGVFRGCCGNRGRSSGTLKLLYEEELVGARSAIEFLLLHHREELLHLVWCVEVHFCCLLGFESWVSCFNDY